MKKYLIFLLGIISFLGINTVSAETIDYDVYYIDEYELLKDDNIISILENKFSMVINDILKKHNYYIARIGISGDKEPYLAIYTYDTSFTNYSQLASYTCSNELKTYYYFLESDYSIRSTSSGSSSCYGSGPLVISIKGEGSNYIPNNYYFSNMEIIYDLSDVGNFIYNEEILLTLNYGDVIPTYKNASDFTPESACESWDFTCKFDKDIGDVSDVFDAPMDFLESIWTSITSIFGIMFEFFTLLPEPMQGILYVSFMVAIFIGIIKIIL